MIKYWLTELSQQGRDKFARQCCGLHFTQHEYIVIHMSFFIEMFLPCFIFQVIVTTLGKIKGVRENLKKKK